RGPPAAFGVGVAPEVAVIPRVGIDQAAHSAVLVGKLGLQAAPALAVTHDHDLALYADAVPRQLLVVVGHSVVDVYQRGRHVAIGAVRVVRRQCSAQGGCPVTLDGRLVQG